MKTDILKQPTDPTIKGHAWALQVELIGCSTHWQPTTNIKHITTKDSKVLNCALAQAWRKSLIT